MKVEIYRNLTKDCYSVRDYKTKRVIDYIDFEETFVLTDVVFKVGKGGNKRVNEEKTKNVHAFIVGDIVYNEPVKHSNEFISYNPYKHPYFYYVGTDKAIQTAEQAIFNDRRISVIGGWGYEDK